MSVDILGTSWDQCRSMVQYSFTSTEIRRLVRMDSPGRPPRLSHSSWTIYSLLILAHIIIWQRPEAWWAQYCDVGTVRVMFHICSQQGDIRPRLLTPPPPPPPPPLRPSTHTHTQTNNNKRAATTKKSYIRQQRQNYILVSYTNLPIGPWTISLTIEVTTLVLYKISLATP